MNVSDENIPWLVRNLHDYGNSLVPDVLLDEFGEEKTRKLIVYGYNLQYSKEREFRTRRNEDITIERRETDEDFYWIATDRQHPLQKTNYHRAKS